MKIKTKIQEQLYLLYKKKEIKEHALKYLFLEITRKCNLNCLHCGSDCKNTINDPELTTESWIKLIHFVHQTYGNQVAFILTGGEPLLHPDIFLIGKTISSLGMRWGMVTNGTLISETTINQLIEAGIYSITISFDGNEDSHNYIRNTHSAYKQVLKALQLIAKSNIAMRDAVTCVYPGNVKQLDEISELLLAHSFPAWRLFRIFPSGRAANNENLLLTYEQTWEMVNWIKKTKPTLAKRGLSVNYSCEGYLPYETDRKIRDVPFFCRAGINIASILSNGFITGCSNNHSTFYEGNVLTDNFSYIWENRFEKFRKREWLNKTTCADCKVLSKCMGSSIHLWNLEKEEIAFCYLKNNSTHRP